MRIAALPCCIHLVFSPLFAGASPATSASFTMKEVAKHSTQSDCWIVIENKVYDVTAYIGDHPAPSHLLIDACGKDASAGWKTKGERGKPHSRKADLLLKKFFKGDLFDKPD